MELFIQDSGVLLNRVWVGPFQSYSEAQQTIDKLEPVYQANGDRLSISAKGGTISIQEEEELLQGIH